MIEIGEAHLSDGGPPLVWCDSVLETLTGIRGELSRITAGGWSPPGSSPPSREAVRSPGPGPEDRATRPTSPRETERPSSETRGGTHPMSRKRLGLLIPSGRRTEVVSAEAES
jgi:hypothetical protein